MPRFPLPVLFLRRRDYACLLAVLSCAISACGPTVEVGDRFNDNVYDMRVVALGDCEDLLSGVDAEVPIVNGKSYPGPLQFQIAAPPTGDCAVTEGTMTYVGQSLPMAGVFGLHELSDYPRSD